MFSQQAVQNCSSCHHFDNVLSKWWQEEQFWMAGWLNTFFFYWRSHVSEYFGFLSWIVWWSNISIICYTCRQNNSIENRVWIVVHHPSSASTSSLHDDVIKWKHFPRYWPFVRGIHRSPVNSTHKGQWRGALMFSLICARINGWVNNGEAGDLRRYRVHCDVIVMKTHCG